MNNDNNIKFYFAPMEGITGHVYRNAHNEIYSGVDKYFMPFVSANHTLNFQTKEKKDFSPENNVGINVVPQILTNNAKAFTWAVKELNSFGYEEINLNLGCPSGTVASKGKGSGFLSNREGLLRFLDEVFDDSDVQKADISIKTRAGRYEHDELYELIKIYNRFPLSELIIHPRVQKDMYRNTPDITVFSEVSKESKAPVCYNGDIFSVEDFIEIQKILPSIDRFMLGRGAIANPQLFEHIKGISEDFDKERLKAFLEKVFNTYYDSMGEMNSINKMKEIWSYVSKCFPDNPKEIKTIRKTRKKSEYVSTVRAILRQ